MKANAVKTALSMIEEALDAYEQDFIERVSDGDSTPVERIAILEDLKYRLRMEMEQAEIECTRLLIEQHINVKELHDTKKD